VQSNVLDGKPDANIHIFAIFYEMVAGDQGAKQNVAPSSLLDDPRVTVYWDRPKVVGRWYESNVTKLGQRENDPDRIEWDAYFLYAPDAEWADAHPSVVSWGRTVHGQRQRLLRDLDALLARAGEASGGEESR
jgi:hypothetical protein